MKFSEKFELLESLTTGAIETFAANDKVRGERVLVHIVECSAQRPEQSMSEWVLESFRRLAPEPAGPVLEAGRYSGAVYAYLVTKPPDEAAVKSWVRRYELQSQETKETSIQRLKEQINVPPPTPSVPPVVAPHEAQPAPGQMTQLFRDFDSLAKSRASAVPESQPPARPVNLAAESGLHAAAPWDPASIKPAAPPKERIPESFPTSAQPAAPELRSTPVGEGPKPGEFTSFFQGPFRGDAPSDVPAFSSEPIEPARKSVGEFTAMFGSATPQPSESSPAGRASSFTGLFKDMEKPPSPFNSTATPPGGVVPPPVEPFPVPSAPKDQSLSPQAPIFVPPPAPVAMAPPPVIPVAHPSSTPVEAPMPVRPGSLPGDGATGAFMHPSSEPVPTPVQVPSGPSPYTQIISRQKLAGEESAEAGTQTPASPAGGGFSVPRMPSVPAAASPPIPRIPPAPAIPLPKMTGPKAPAAAKAPKLDTAAPPPVSFWPLIITLTVLFFLAVILVLYFLLKH